ncbi:MAG: hypothetical protein RL757_1588 [Bacteroidota bacterium]|jgi:hypothetical protein
MKRMIIFAAAMIAACHCFAQQVTVSETGESVSLQLNRVLQHVSLAPVTSGRLMTKSIGFINIADYNGRMVSDSTDIDIDKFGYLYAMTVMSQTNGNTLPNPRPLYSEATVASNAPTPLVVLAQRYHYLKPDAVTNNLLRVENGQLYDVAGRTESPFAEDIVFAAMPIQTDFTSRTVQLVLPADKLVSNLGTIR